MRLWTVVMLSSWFDVARAVPSGFTNNKIFADNLSFITDFVFAPEGMGHLMFVTQKSGLIHVHEPGADYRYEDNAIAIDITELVCDEGEGGLGGIQLHPDFANNGWIYTYYMFPKHGNCDEYDFDNGPVNRLSRWMYDSSTNAIDPESEVVLLDTPSTATVHNGGKIEFGKDGNLYVSIGDLGLKEESQNLTNVVGSIIRLTDTGDIPPDNPFANNGVRCHLTGRSNGTCQELYATGLRNPWRFAMDPNTDGKVRFFVNDVGASAWEEISEGGDDFKDAAAFGWLHGLQNFGWPEREGPCKRGMKGGYDDYEGYIHPIHYYEHQGGGAATGAAFVPNEVWPEEYNNKFLYADFALEKIFSFSVGGQDCAECTPANSGKNPEVFLSHKSITTMRFGPYINGTQVLYYASLALGGTMQQVVCDVCLTPIDDSESVNATTLSIAAPTGAPTGFVLPSRPDGEGGYPGVLFPWNSGTQCPDGYDYCGVLEFCMGESLSQTGANIYGYQLRCDEGEICECTAAPGPLIRLVPGNKYRLTLRNAGTEVTNLHTHGLHIVGDGDGDDVLREVMGGNCLDYTWDIPMDHPGGTNWYHAHHHGSAQEQVGGGAYGMLIVEDNTNLDPILPTWATNERLLQVAVTVSTDEISGNGRKNEVIDIAAKQWYRLRVSLVNADAVPYNFTFDDIGMCDIHKVAQDGVWRSVIPGPKSSTWELTGASRADFAIRCNTVDALVPIYYRDDELVAMIWVGSDEDLDARHTMGEFIPNRPYSISDMLSETVPDSNRLSVRLGFDYVNDGKWDPLEPIATIAYDQVHEWTLMQTWLHPFHMHLYHMQIATPGGCGAAHEEGEFYDTISAPGNCTVRFRTADIGQRCILHCHVLFHEDNGSMSWVNVTGKNMPMNTVQSPEYACPASTLSQQDSTVAPVSTSSPLSTDLVGCVPGFLGITNGAPLLDNEIFVNQDFGIFIQQQGDGNLVVRHGTPEDRGEVIWAHGERGNASTYFTKLNGNSNLVTMTGTPADEGTPLWEAGVINPDGEYFLGINCNKDIVSIYAGDPNELSGNAAVSVWNSVPTTTPTTSPTASSSTQSSPITGNTGSPTHSPVAPPNRCVPGFLGITNDIPLLKNEVFINEEYGVFVQQQGDGNLVVRRGTPENREAVVWAHGARGNASSYYAKLDADSNLMTRAGTPDSEGALLWEAGIANPQGEYFLGIDCSVEIVSVYAGTLSDINSAVSVWNSAPTDAPTAAPISSSTQSPTSDDNDSAPTAAPIGSSTQLPTNEENDSAPTVVPATSSTQSPTSEDVDAAPTTVPATSAPTTVPVASSTQSATDGCVPGYLGIATSHPLLDNEIFVNEEFGVYTVQQGDGNLVVRRGTPEDQGDTVWAHGARGNASSFFFTELERNSNLLTVEESRNDGESNTTVLWSAGIDNALGDYFLGIDCTREIVGIYAGDRMDPGAAVSVWDSSAA